MYEHLKHPAQENKPQKNVTLPLEWCLFVYIISSIASCASLTWDTLAYSILVELLLTECKSISANFHETTVLTGLELIDN